MCAPPQARTLSPPSHTYVCLLVRLYELVRPLYDLCTTSLSLTSIFSTIAAFDSAAYVAFVQQRQRQQRQQQRQRQQHQWRRASQPSPQPPSPPLASPPPPPSPPCRHPTAIAATINAAALAAATLPSALQPLSSPPLLSPPLPPPSPSPPLPPGSPHRRTATTTTGQALNEPLNLSPTARGACCGLGRGPTPGAAIAQHVHDAWEWFATSPPVALWPVR